MKGWQHLSIGRLMEREKEPLFIHFSVIILYICGLFDFEELPHPFRLTDVPPTPKLKILICTNRKTYSLLIFCCNFRQFKKIKSTKS
jgi:hypothetical protein